MSFIIFPESEKVGKTENKFIQPLKVEYRADIHDRFALCCLKQTYNITRNITHASYQFPVDYNSAFYDLIIKTPREEIRGVVTEKNDANKIYNSAKSEGKQAFLAEQTEDDRDIYKISMCNLLNGDCIIVEYTYITEIVHTSGNNIFYIPSFISPRYNGKYIPCGNHSVEVTVIIHNKIGSIKCSIPNISIDLARGYPVLDYGTTEPLEKDIEIIYDTKLFNRAIKFVSNGYTMGIAQFTPPHSSTESECQINHANKEILFILDCSASMSGDRIKNSKKAIIHCLKKMRNCNYSFNIIQYGSKHKLYSNSMLESNEKNISTAIQFCENIEATFGGTETYNALDACLKICMKAILITDGDTTCNKDMHELCKQFTCLSILGIGSGINRANITDMTRNGSGIALFSQESSGIERNMDIIFDSIFYVSTKNPFFNWQNHPNNILTVHPIIHERPNIVYAILDGNPDTNTFKFAGVSDVQIELEVEENFARPFHPKYLGCLVAKRIIQENEIGDNLTEEQMIKLATDFNIIIDYTSLVAVSSNIVMDPLFSNLLDSLGSKKSAAKERLYTDYLFDYFMNEDKFHDQLRGEWDERLNAMCNKNGVSDSDTKELNSVSDDDGVNTPERKTGRETYEINIDPNIVKEMLYSDEDDNESVESATTDDDLFDYFMNHDVLREKIGDHISDNSNESVLSGESDATTTFSCVSSTVHGDITDMPFYSGRNTNQQQKDIQYTNLDIEVYRHAFGLLKTNLESIKFANSDLVYFNDTTKLFEVKSVTVVKKMPIIFQKDYYMSTIFVLLCLKYFSDPNFSKFFEDAIKNIKTVEIIRRLNIIELQDEYNQYRL